MNSLKIVCIVDAFSTGAELASQFAPHGYQAVHVRSSQDVDNDLAATFRPKDFQAEAVFKGDMEPILSFIHKWNPLHVIAGTETGVILADQLAATAGVAGNSPATSALRRNKYEMNEALRQAGIPSVKQHCCFNKQEALLWVQDHHSWPVVAKPLDSAGTDDVYFCSTPAELERACDRILYHNNRMGGYNDRVLVQECLVGQQYFINAVSLNGQHRFTEIWKDTKVQVDGAGMICDREDLLTYEGPVQEQIIAYMSRVLDCLGVHEGASHSELMFTANGPILIESAARMQGTILHDALIAATGESHVTSTAERYLDPENFLTKIGKGYELRQYLSCITLASHESGIVVANNVKDRVSSLPSFYAVFHTPEVGDKILRTVDLFSNPGIIYLLHENSDQVNRDYKQIREWEAAKVLFKVRSDVNVHAE